jgi:molecular chaperone DnaJ
MSVATVKRDYYEVLGVAKSADGEEIRRSYRKLAMKYHPDRADGDKTEAETKFKECAEAYEILSDPEKRRRYDQFGHSGMGGHHDFSHMDVADIFSMFDEIFGGAFGGRRGGRGAGGGGGAVPAQRGFDLETQVELSLEEVAAGAEKTIEFDRQAECEHCKGSGAKPGTSPVVCPQCGGQGRIAQQGFGGMFRMVTTCPACRGKGSVVKDHCPSCRGTGRQMKKRVVKVNIPPGVHEGQAVRVAGEGEPGTSGGPPGDLHCYITVKQHTLFSRHNNDLVCQIPISFTQASLGARITVPTLAGHEEMDVPAGTQHGEVFKLRGKGLPDLRSKRSGDELVQILIEIPRKLSEKQKQILRDFAATEDASVLPQSKSFLEKIRDKLRGDS